MAYDSQRGGTRDHAAHLLESASTLPEALSMLVVNGVRGEIRSHLSENSVGSVHVYSIVTPAPGVPMH